MYNTYHDNGCDNRDTNSHNTNMNTTTKKTNYEKIEENIAHLVNVKEQIAVRIQTFKDLIVDTKRLRAEAGATSVKEIIQEAIDEAQATVVALSGFEEDVTYEIKRAQKARRLLDSDDISEIKKAFETFIVTDTSFSIKNSVMGFYNYDREIEALRSFNNVELDD